MSGWIKLHRSIQEHWLYKEKRSFSKFEAWNDILLTVNYCDAQTIIKGKIYNIKRGQSILSLDSWSKRWNWDKSKVRRFLKLLQSENMIVLESDTQTTQLTVCKYDTYQSQENESETKTKRKRNANETQTTPIKEEEEIKEEEKEKEITIVHLDEFLAYALEKKPMANKTDLKHKYESWVENGWAINRSGKLEPIINWKSTLLNTLKYISEVKPQNKTISL